jgi:hypothetical protein
MAVETRRLTAKGNDDEEGEVVSFFITLNTDKHY